MRTVGWALAALILGLVLGGLGPRADWRKAQQEVARLKDEARKTGKKDGQLAGIRAMLKLNEDRNPAAGASPAAPSGKPTGTATGGVSRTVTVGVSATGMTVSAETARPATNRATMRDQIQTAADLWKVRVDLARNSFLENVAADEADVAEFDLMMEAMNRRLSNSIRTWVETVKTNGVITPETGLRMMNDLSSAVVQGYDDLDRVLPAGWREKSGGEFEVFEFINPDVALPLTEIEEAVRVREGASRNRSGAIGRGRRDGRRP
jgi:hypothetical protein